MDIDVSQILDNADKVATAVEAAKTAFDVSKKIREKFKKKDNPLLDRYYNDIMDDLDKDEKSVLTGNGALSNDEVYIDAYSVEYPETKILNTIDRWSSKDDYGVMLIHGEPGHGKTTLCRKAVYEYGMDRFCKDKTNVFWFRLNPAFAEGIIEDGTFVFKNAFCWGDPEIKLSRILLEENEKEYQNSVVFLDGYDELKAQLHGINLNLTDFIRTAEKFAKAYNMHIIITTRTRSLDDEFVSSSVKKLQFAPMSEEQQNKWIEKNAPDYKEDFEVLRSSSSEEMEEMLGIPILFRMAVEAQLKSTTAQNVVDLYDTLFEATMERRELESSKVGFWHQNYQDLAHEIYCNDEQFVDVQGEQQTDEFLYMFYIKGEGKQHVEFLHRSFYQYFLAHFLYQKMSEVEDEKSAEAFLCCLAERRIDRDVLNYIQQIQEKKPDVTQKKCEQIINTLEQTGAVIERALKVSNERGNAEKHRLRRCNNIFVNALNICCIVADSKKSNFIISLRYKENLHASMQRYNCSNIWLENVTLSGATLDEAKLSGANLIDADLSEAYLKRANLSEAKLNKAKLNKARLNEAQLNKAKLNEAELNGAVLTGAKLIEANLTGAKLSEAILSEANLSKADLIVTDLIITDLRIADLSKADLSKADLSRANLTGADLTGADLRWAINLDKCHCKQVTNWKGCKILLRDKDNLGLDDPDAHGIIWCDNETGKPIKP